jgi:DNA polymerase-3 subunit delta'
MELALHPATSQHLRYIANRPKGAYLFCGPTGVGRKTAAVWLAKQLHCGNTPQCATCHLIDTSAYGDFIVVEPADAGSVGIAQVQELLATLGRSRIEKQGVRMVVIDQANKLTTEAQNSLLKTVEEPPEDTIIVMVANNETDLLATIRSRCEVVNFLPLPEQEIVKYLTGSLNAAEDAALSAAALSLGSVGTAVGLVRDQSMLAALEELANTIANVRRSEPFQRLLLAGKLQDSSADISQFVGLLSSALRQALRRGEAVPVQSLEAVERFDRYLKANVNGRSAWSRVLFGR